MKFFQIPEFYLPSFSKVLDSLLTMIFNGTAIYGAFATIVRFLCGAVLGIVSGVIIGYLMGEFKIAHRLLDYIVSMSYPIPKIAILPILIVWMGIGETPKIFMAWLGMVYPVLINTVVGTKNVNKIIRMVSIDLGMNKFEYFRYVVLPNSLPLIFAGIKLGAGISFTLVVATEMLMSKNGLGHLAQNAGSIYAIDELLSIMIILAILGTLQFVFVDFLERLIVPWNKQTGSDKN